MNPIKKSPAKRRVYGANDNQDEDGVGINATTSIQLQLGGNREGKKRVWVVLFDAGELELPADKMWKLERKPQ